jgi:AcrR family transcriptional regulator
VTKPTIYYHISNKQELLFECFAAVVAQIRVASRDLQDRNVPARVRLHLFLRNYAKAIASEFGWVMGKVDEQDWPAEVGARVKAMQSEIDQIIQQLIREGIQDSSIHPCDPKMTALALAGSLNWIAHWYRERRPINSIEIADAFITVFDNGLKPRHSNDSAS